MSAIEGSVIVVVGGNTYLGARIVERLAARTQPVVALGHLSGGAGGDGSPDGVRRAPGVVAEVVVEGEGVEAVGAAIEKGAAGRRVVGVVHAEIEVERCAPAALGQLTPEVWRERCARPIDSALWTARAGFEVMATGDGRPGRGGLLGFVCPSVALTGDAGHVALSATSEAIRLLAKSAARRWGRFGITSNAFAPSVGACMPPPVDGDGTGAGGLQVHATALDDVDPADDIASLLIYLTDPGAARLTGATLGTDGGELMAP